MRAQSKLAVLTRPMHANFTEVNHLGAAFMAEPHKFDKVLTRVFTASRMADNPLLAMTKGMGRTSEIASFDWEWELMGSSSRPLVATAAASGSAAATSPPLPRQRILRPSRLSGPMVEGR